MPTLVTSDYLRIIEALPDLLAMASEQACSPGDILKIQGELREAYRRERLPFKWTMPMRHSYHCYLCNHTDQEVLYELENPEPQHNRHSLRLIKLLESELHQLRCHNGYLKDEYCTFLANLPVPTDVMKE